MSLGNSSDSARLLRGLHGVRLGFADQNGEVLTIENECDSHGEFPRIDYSRGTQLVSGEKVVSVWKAAWDSRPHWFKLSACHHLGDRSIMETIVNVATSVPFVAVGLQIPRKKPASRLFGDSLIGVGVASSLYHVSRGDARKVFRIGDYAMIAVASVCLNSALRESNSRALMLASALLIPVQPMLVTVLHTGMMEATFARRALREPKLRRAHSLHQLSSAVGGALFVADDMMPQTPYIHAAWHLAAALSVATSAKLLD